MGNVHFPADAHAAMNLNGFLSHLASRRADLVLDEADRALGVCFPLRGAHGCPQQQRVALLAVGEHVHHAVLQRLETADRHAELHAVLRVLDRLVRHDLHDADGFRADGQRRIVDGGIQRGETLARLADNARAIHGDVIETDLRRLLPIHRGIRPDIEAIAVGGHGKQRDAVFIVLRARNPGGNDQQLGIAAVENDTFLATEYPAVAVRRSRGPDVGDIVATLWLRVRESGLQLTGDDRL